MTESLYLKFMNTHPALDIRTLPFLSDCITISVQIGRLFKEKSKRILAKTQDQKIVILAPPDPK